MNEALVTAERRFLQTIVAQFLRSTLAGGAKGVPELELMARTARLLGEHQPITHSKLFKKVKQSLGVRSIRKGFGSGGKWLWSLEKKPAQPDTEPSIAGLARSLPIEDTYADLQSRNVLIDDPEVAPAGSRVCRVPSNWIDGVARLNLNRPPIGVPLHRWRQFFSDCNNFLTADKTWAERAAELGWDAVALFGCSPSSPLSHLGSAGLLWVINGGSLVELHRDWAVIELAGNGSRRVFDRRRVDTGKVTLPWTEVRERSGA